jgi:hypothetical protein
MMVIDDDNDGTNTGGGDTDDDNKNNNYVCHQLSCSTYFFDPEDGGEIFLQNVG